MSDQKIFEDTFNLLCGRFIGEGVHRKVFECKLRPDLVVKVESVDDNGLRNFMNVFEMNFWDRNEYNKKVSEWLAPCEYLSPDGCILLQKKTEPVSKNVLPDKLPAFLTDIKPTNFGMLNGKIVCIDYAMTIENPSVRMKSVKKQWKDFD
jgi:hypothetical protein